MSDDAGLQFPHAFPITALKCAGEVLASSRPP